MQLGLCTLKLAPAAFWAMTPRELAAALNLRGGAEAPLDRTAFDALRARYPDGT